MRSLSTEFFYSRKTLITRLKACAEVFMVYDRNVEAFAEDIADEAGIEACLGISVGNKTMETVEEICRFLLEAGADREALLLAVGGGTLTDIAGFAASIYMRGIKCAYVPTTVLAQADAAIGGKTGVNLDSFKNILGTFSAPLFVCALEEPLQTLPRREMLSGIAEMLKTFIALDAPLYQKAVTLISAGEYEGVHAFILESARLKAEVVERDPYEKGERKLLNLGHTFGHAIEWYEASRGTERPMFHGEAVSVGIILAAKLSEEKGIAEKGLVARLKHDFAACGLPTECPYPISDLEEAMLHDKKNRDAKISYVYIKKIGEAVWSA